MKVGEPIPYEVLKIDYRIDAIKLRMQLTDELIMKLMKRNSRRRELLGRLSSRRSELMTFELIGL